VQQVRNLSSKGSDDPGVPVSGTRYREPGGQVDVTVSVRIPYVAAASPPQEDGELV
jgi:hypothetical protein